MQAALQWGLPFVVEAVLVLGFGRTVGEWVVSLHTVPRRRGLLLPGRLVKLAVGVGPLFVLAPLWNQVVGPVAIALLAAYAVLTVVFAWRTSNHRGLSHTLGHLDLRIGDDADADPADPSTPPCVQYRRHGGQRRSLRRLLGVVRCPTRRAGVQLRRVSVRGGA